MLTRSARSSPSGCVTLWWGIPCARHMASRSTFCGVAHSGVNSSSGTLAAMGRKEKMPPPATGTVMEGQRSKEAGTPARKQVIEQVTGKKETSYPPLVAYKLGKSRGERQACHSLTGHTDVKANC